MGLKVFVLIKLHLTMHVSLSVLRAAGLLSNSGPLLFKDYAKGFISLVNKKRHLMMLSRGCYELYPVDNVMFRVNISKARII